MKNVQPGILGAEPSLARYLEFSLVPDEEVAPCLESLRELADGDRGAGLDGSSFAAVQQWVHGLDHFQRRPQAEQDHVIGRRLSDNEELDDAPESAQVKRTAQESVTPEAFILRKSMPWRTTGFTARPCLGKNT